MRIEKDGKNGSGSTSRRQLLRALSAAAVMGGGLHALAADEKPAKKGAPADAPATAPADPAAARKAAKREGDRKRIEEYMLKEYDKLMKSPDWVRRSLGIISYAKLPVPESIPVLLHYLNEDKHAVVQMLAFEGLRARAEWVSAEQHKQWITGTYKLARKGAFRGRLRAGMFDVLATGPMTDRAFAQQRFIDVVANSNSLVADDAMALDAAGRCLAAWRHDAVADLMVTAAGSATFESRRAGRMLKAAGFPVNADATVRAGGTGAAATRPTAVDSSSLATWWKNEKTSWKTAPAVPAGEWKKVKPDILPFVSSGTRLDPDEPLWMKEVELGKPELRNFDLAFLIDVSGSMGPALKFMQREVTGMMQAMTILAREPRIGLTFFSGGAFTFKTYPLSGDIKQILGALNQQKIIGGGEELVIDALKDSLAKNPWPKGEGSAKIMVLVGDEAIVPRQVPLCKEVAEQAKANGYRIFGLSPNRIPPTIADLAKQGGGEAVLMPLPATGGAPKPPLPALEAPGVKLMSGIIGTVLSPAFKDRIAPLVATVLLVHSETFTEG